MKKLTSLIFMTLFVFSMFAQEQNFINVALIQPTVKPNTSAAYLNEIVSNITAECLSKNKRIQTIDRSNTLAVIEEQGIQASEFVNLESTVGQGGLIGASYLMKTQVVGLTMNKAYSKDENGKASSLAGYQCTVNVSMSVVDAETGRTVISKTMPAKSFVISNPKSAFMGAIKSVEPNVRKLIKEAFPFELGALKISSKNGKARDIILKGGNDLGIQKNDRLEVYAIDKHSSFEKMVGVVRVKTVNGPEFCTVIPTKKAKDILKQANNAQNELVFRSSKREGFLAGVEKFAKEMDTTYLMVPDKSFTL